jgi:hypothetical protein
MDTKRGFIYQTTFSLDENIKFSRNIFNHFWKDAWKDHNLPLTRYFYVYGAGTLATSCISRHLGLSWTLQHYKFRVQISTARPPSIQSGNTGKVNSAGLFSTLLGFSGAVDLSVCLVVTNPGSDRVHLVSATSAPPSSCFHFLPRQR